MIVQKILETFNGTPTVNDLNESVGKIHVVTSQLAQINHASELGIHVIELLSGWILVEFFQVVFKREFLFLFFRQF